MICPKCGAEYQPGFTSCADCGVDLVESLPPPLPRSEPSAVLRLPEPRSDPPEEFALVTVFATLDPGLMGIAESLLRSADIPFVSEADDIVDLFGIGRLSGCNPITGSPRLCVAPQDADDARALLDDLAASDGLVGSDEVAQDPTGASSRTAEGLRVEPGVQVAVKDSTPRPRSVWVAQLLIVATWATSMVTLAWRLLVSPTLPNEKLPPVAMSVVVLLIAMGLSGGLVAALVYRRRWAYIVWMVLFALSLVSLPLGGSPAPAFDQAPLRTVYWFVSWAAQIVAVVLLLRRPARAWYGFGRPAVPPGEWRPDPGGVHQYRYWDGERWTEHVADEGLAGVDPLAQPQLDHDNEAPGTA